VTLSAQHLTLTRGKTRLVSGLSLAVEPRQLWLLEGPNGSGKTTLLRALAGLTPADEGEIVWQTGADRASVRSNARFASALAWCPHHAPWKDELTADENLTTSLALAGVTAAAAARHAALAGVGLAGQRQLPAKRLSQGQRKRLVLAWLALVKRPLWLMDEPQNALDEAGRALLHDALKSHMEQGGAAVVATHMPQNLEGIATGRLRLGDASPIVLPSGGEGPYAH
jgi:heme exporter protein A